VGWKISVGISHSTTETRLFFGMCQAVIHSYGNSVIESLTHSLASQLSFNACDIHVEFISVNDRAANCMVVDNGQTHQFQMLSSDLR
jgi:hypothetical protein